MGVAGKSAKNPEGGSFPAARGAKRSADGAYKSSRAAERVVDRVASLAADVDKRDLESKSKEGLSKLAEALDAAVESLKNVRDVVLEVMNE